jgi:hypothetical protein
MRETTHRILDSGINTADLEVQWEKLLEVAKVTDPKLAKAMEHGIFSWDDPAGHDAVKLKLIATIAAM